MNIKYTSNGNNKWGLVQSEFEIQYVEKKNHNAAVILTGLILIALIATFILSHI